MHKPFVSNTTYVVVWSDVLCFESDSSVLLIYDIPTLNNEIVSSGNAIVLTENNFGFVSKIRSSFSFVNLWIKS